MSKPVAFVLGFGHNIGSHVARKFKQEGFDVAVASRSLDPEALQARGYLGIRLDLGRVSDIATAFDQVEAIYGPACVVVYNGMCPPQVKPSSLMDRVCQLQTRISPLWVHRILCQCHLMISRQTFDSVD